jgi:hypothetical protein
VRTVIVLEIDHRKPIPALANLIAGRAYTIDGVTNAEPYKLRALTYDELNGIGFTEAEIALGSQEVVR